MNECPRLVALQAAVAGTLDADRLEQLERHLEHCPVCQQALVSMTEEAKVLPVPPCGPEHPGRSELLQQVVERMDKRPRG